MNNITNSHSPLLIKVLILTLLLSVTLILPKSANAASKEYEVYKKIKTGMTVVEVAKLIYGKTYKSHLKKEYGATIFDKRPFYRDISDKSKNYEFGFYAHDKNSNSMYSHKIGLGLFTKKDNEALYVGWKSYSPENPSMKKFYENKKPNYGMTINQVDKILSGKGLGVFDHLYTSDLTKFGYVDKNNKNLFPNKESWIYYKARSYSGNTDYYLFFNYDYKKKTYIYEKQ
ncbi:hypothetical protein [Exiguobacterium sp. s133]|uniref:hypothetical protein n=1 Tax=Exiguobacterium sp. s133 TaxID=2751213 RepID=UPI001BEB82A2|nr:hypothetical protein [Exiguobacterium sp. s133]